MRKLKLIAAVATALALVFPVAGAGAAEQIDKSDNVKRIGGLRYEGGTELAAGGKYVYSSQLDGGAEAPSRGTVPDRGGFYIHDVSGKKPKLVGQLKCPGNDNDVEFVRPGLVLLGFATNKCAPSAGEGFMTIDVRNPKKPRVLGAVNTNTNHTFKPFPNAPLVYTAGGGLTGGTGAGPAIVDISNPSRPEVVAKGQTLTMDCHDISFWQSKDRETTYGFCAGAVGTGEVQIWDVNDPLKPTRLGTIVNPAIQYSHYAVASSDGKVLAIDDEAFAAHDCNTGQSPTGRVWIYDISTPELPILQSSFAPPARADGGTAGTGIGTFPGWIKSWCLSHGLDWQPGTRNLGVTWFTSGWSVLNLDDPMNPKEVAYFDSNDSATYSVLWHNNNLYTNDSIRGFDAFAIKGLK